MQFPYFPLYVQDFLIGTIWMSNDEIGGYMKLLLYQWDKGGLPDDEKAILKISGLKIKSLKNVIKKFNLCDDKLLKNERLEIERKKLIKFYFKNRANGSLGGRPRKDNGKPNVNPDETHGLFWVNPDETHGQPSGGENQNQNQNTNTPTSYLYANPEIPLLLLRHKTISLADMHYVPVVTKLGVAQELIPEWMDVFNLFLCQMGDTEKSMADWRFHFKNWLKKIPDYPTMHPNQYGLNEKHQKSKPGDRPKPNDFV